MDPWREMVDLQPLPATEALPGAPGQSLGTSGLSALGVLDVGLEPEGVAQARLREPDDVVVLVLGAGDVAGLGGTDRSTPMGPDERSDGCGHLVGCFHLQQVGDAGDVGVTAVGEPVVEQLSALGEQRAAVGAEDRQHRARDARGLLRTERPRSDGRQFGLEERGASLMACSIPPGTVRSSFSRQALPPTSAANPSTAPVGSPCS
jgi:hypothetical protein